MASFSFILTEKCDWSCSYCQFPLLSNKNEIESDKISKHLPYIRETISKIQQFSTPAIEIQGGEIGLIDENVLIMFLEQLNQKVMVSTNGLFLKKGYHLNKKIRPYIKEIQWHVCDKPGPFKSKDYNDPDIFINKGIVDESINKIVKFIEYNPQITFNYVELECDINEKKTGAVDDYNEFYDRIKGLSNITDSAKERIKNRKDDVLERDKCYKFHECVSINMASETICLCQRCLESSIPLTKENLIKRLTDFPKFIFSSGVGCRSCTRLYKDKYNISTVKNTLKIRKELK